LNLKGTDYFWQQGINIGREIALDVKVDYESIRKRETYRFELDHLFLPETLLAKSNNYVLHPQQDSVAGVPCWVLEWKGMDKCWIDPECGFEIRRRRCHWKPDGPLKYEITSKDFRKELPGLWTPWVRVINLYTSIHSEKPELWGKVASELRYEVVDVDLEHAPDSFFELQFPVGTVVYDKARDLKYQVPSVGADPFEAPIKELTKRRWMRTPVAVIGLFLFSIFCWVAWNYRGMKP